MSFKIVPTPPFEKELKNLAKKYPSLKKDISALFVSLAKSPKSGTPLGSNCFKVRLAITSKGKGKSGGARVITYIQIIDEEIFLIAIYDKSEIDSISLNAIRDRLKALN
ncbi:MAG: type II toxin-antitoxin system RelE/ParE family toxin [Cytophagales bacterium]|jgi:mRNA-degrading endonuclease RelE of RelBE toxin-antitoxin system|nr:type II toxin-antitoxin system RelE/ParE family toxin [Cytophagales bacterium]MCA6389083.1 type II toxin-antitoxin system RelE/ParE family toxin [Cytophagales bacterium]MCA6393534.1 type II toxin-antitoxin system RelE/ParE family toxin [Cytophagales bacterium]MCA6396125.1 type II toxin-antitoxin system RelE/ParE family toxin [Cytophagales bacterium]MCA6399624.1 type II toxin-antitoxin system RelE/ParE family toxin [Cytophagales bacterium]